MPTTPTTATTHTLPRRRGLLLGVGLLLVALIAVALTQLVRPATPAFRLDADSETLRFEDLEPLQVGGLPDTVTTDRYYPVRILLPLAAPGSRVELVQLLDPGLLEPLDVLLCAPGTTGDAEPSTCDVRVRSSSFAYSSETTLELPALVRFDGDVADFSPLAVRYVVHPPRSWWPFGAEEVRTYRLGDVVVERP